MREAIPNLRHLAAFHAAGERGSLSAAATIVHMTQPAVSQAIASLERDFGAKLLDRSSLGAALTDAGRLCAARIERLLVRLRGAVAELTADASAARHVGRGITATQLLALSAVSDAGGFGPAARAQGVTRATFYRLLRQLEATLGTPLLETTSHGLRPTREAERLAVEVRLAAAELAQARAEVAALVGSDRGGTVIGAMPLARSFIVPSAVLHFSVRWPGHSVAILDGPYENLLQALKLGRADVLVGALRQEIPNDVLQEHLFDDPLAIVVRAKHPLARVARAPKPKELRNYAWIAPRLGSPLRRHYEALLKLIGVMTETAPIECNSLVAARAMLLTSDRLMLLSAHQVRQELVTGELTLLPHPLGRVTRAIGLTIRRGWVPTPAQCELLDAIRSRAASAGLASSHQAGPLSESSRSNCRIGK
jgi:LysR family transcriptional regulator, regulator for genes of the gallate degradation pathway